MLACWPAWALIAVFRSLSCWEGWQPHDAITYDILDELYLHYFYRLILVLHYFRHWAIFIFSLILFIMITPFLYSIIDHFHIILALNCRHSHYFIDDYYWLLPLLFRLLFIIHYFHCIRHVLDAAITSDWYWLVLSADNLLFLDIDISLIFIEITPLAWFHYIFDTLPGILLIDIR